MVGTEKWADMKVVPFPVTVATLAADAESQQRAEQARTQLKLNQAQATMNRIDRAYDLTTKELRHD